MVLNWLIFITLFASINFLFKRIDLSLKNNEEYNELFKQKFELKCKKNKNLKQQLTYGRLDNELKKYITGTDMFFFLKFFIINLFIQIMFNQFKINNLVYQLIILFIGCLIYGLRFKFKFLTFLKTFGLFVFIQTYIFIQKNYPLMIFNYHFSLFHLLLFTIIYYIIKKVISNVRNYLG